MPPLSVILCTHDRPGYLEACLAGLAGQDCAAGTFEAIVVDSASPEPGASRIAALAAAAGARLVRCSEPGLSLARNEGLAVAAAPWVAYLDDDAVPEPAWASTLVSAIARAPAGTGCIGGRILPHWEAPLPPWWPEDAVGTLTVIEHEGAGLVGDGSLPAGVEPYGANMAFEAAGLRGIGGFPLDLGRVGEKLISGEEAFVIRRLIAAGRAVIYDGAITVHHSIQAKRLTREWLYARLYWQGVSEAILARRLGQGGAMWWKAARMAAKAARSLPVYLRGADDPGAIRRRGWMLYATGYVRGAFAR
ncbi:glycosyltransferase family 2 protein [Elioraea sp.]|uniref:glycosyltransferase family 2 protein n=1 Tax=Elioraea sp. TaxID=2185103 RepID=UPI0025C58F90|nr:glycosyltransferase family 2 protein [Elioraea sp.]